MGNFAIIENGEVTNIIIADTFEIAEEVTGKKCVDYGSKPIGVGMKYEETKGFIFAADAFDPVGSEVTSEGAN